MSAGLALGANAFPGNLLAQSGVRLTKADLMHRLQTRADEFQCFGVSYAGKEIFHPGCFNSLVSTLGRTGQRAKENWPAQRVDRDITVAWKVRFHDKLSIIDIKNSIFSLVEKKLVPHHHRSYFSGNDKPSLWGYEPKEDNPSTVLPIEENTAEYFPRNSAERDSNHNGVLAIALFQSIGVVTPSAGNQMLGKKLAEDAISDIQQVAASRVGFTVAESESAFRNDVVCELVGESTARVTKCLVLYSGEPVFRIAYAYNSDGIADRIDIATYGWGGGLDSQIRQVLKPASVTKKISYGVASFPGVPVGGVINDRNGQYYYVGSDGKRTEFDHRVERSDQGTD